MGETASQLGAACLGHRTCRVRVSAPLIAPAGVRLLGADRLIPLEKSGHGYHEAIVEGVAPGDLYRYNLGAEIDRADPASRSQPQGVHGPSAIADEQFSWDDPQWSAPALDEYVIYELHVGAFTAEGTFEAVISHLDHFADLGITAVELVPLAEFPGARNWGYDDVYPFAAHHAYGGPAGLKNWSPPATGGVSRACSTSSTTSSAAKAIISATLSRTSLSAISRPGGRRSILTVLTATQYGNFLSRTRFTGSAIAGLTRSASMRSTHSRPLADHVSRPPLGK